MWHVAYFLHSPTRGNKTVRKKLRTQQLVQPGSEAREELIWYQKERLHLMVEIHFFCLTKISLKLCSFSKHLGLCLRCFAVFSFITFHYSSYFPWLIQLEHSRDSSHVSSKLVASTDFRGRRLEHTQTQTEFRFILSSFTLK